MATGSLCSSQAMSHKPRLTMNKGQEWGLEPNLSPSPPEGIFPLESGALLVFRGTGEWHKSEMRENKRDMIG